MKYVLITSAYNEQDHIEKTLDSVINQTILPSKWLVISDGSTDSTDMIIKRYSKEYEFISYLRNEKQVHHSYGAKVKAINWGIQYLALQDYDFIGILDADISFQRDYFETLINKFHDDARLGLTGGSIVELVEGIETQQNISVKSSVAGAVQFYRTECWDAIGSFIPLPHGSEDAVAEVTAKYHGWKVQTDTSLLVRHYGYVGKGSGNIYKAKFVRGISYHQIGYHPLFEIFRCAYRILNPPIIIGSFLELSGFIYSTIKRDKIMLDKTIVKFLRKEQLNRLLSSED